MNDVHDVIIKQKHIGVELKDAAANIDAVLQLEFSKVFLSEGERTSLEHISSNLKQKLEYHGKVLSQIIE